MRNQTIKKKLSSIFKLRNITNTPKVDDYIVLLNARGTYLLDINFITCSKGEI